MMKVIIGLVIVSLLLIGCGGNERQDMEPFAKCLTESGAKMYGAFWCPHCTAQKKTFGKSWRYVKYIECSTPDKQQNEICNNAGINSYPTWEFADGSRRSGEITLSELGRETDCKL